MCVPVVLKLKVLKNIHIGHVAFLPISIDNHHQPAPPALCVAIEDTSAAHQDGLSLRFLVGGEIVPAVHAMHETVPALAAYSEVEF